MKTGSTARKKSTLRDVAEKAGVSVATVSRVLNDSGSVTPETKKRVSDVMEALDFAPSAAARSLNSGRTRTIGTLVPSIDHSIFSRYLNALEETLSARGYGLIVAVTHGSSQIEAQRTQDLLELGVDGVIVSGLDHSPSFHAAVRRFSVPVIVTSFFDTTAAFPTIGYDNAGISREAVEFLKARGHVDIAIIHGPLAESDRTRARLRGATSVEGVKFSTYECMLSVAGADQAMDHLYRMSDPVRPSAVFCLSDVQALGAFFNAQRRGIAIPDDLSIMGFDNLEWSASSTPGITTIDLPSVEMGKKAGAAMIDQLSSGQPAQPLSLAASIVERGSVKRI